VSAEFLAFNSILLAFQALLVGLTGAGIPRWLERAAGRWWALLLPVSIAAVVGGIAVFPELADGLTWVALVLVPPGALLAAGWALRGGRPVLAIVPGVLLVYAFADPGSRGGDMAAAVCTALSAAALGRLLAGGVPGAWLKAAIVAMAVIDAVLVFGNQLQGPAAVLNAAVPAPGLPQFQYLELYHASMGYGDVFVAGVLGGVLAAEGTRQWPVALLVLVLSYAWDMLFLLPDLHTLPATVPIAVAVVLVEWHARRRAGSNRTARALSS
jgi:hypothetical protein